MNQIFIVIFMKSNNCLGISPLHMMKFAISLVNCLYSFCELLYSRSISVKLIFSNLLDIAFFNSVNL